ncbi:jg19906 [Pararge aegeria aegeria]|uniref:Jg19906 protein n=1 Tax=Pararge aegeria aegeria TaxID=348720 RepID=A0A8S4SIG1_9NEOP|nr:jg19906 [Pararge aegeria aegeria]
MEYQPHKDATAHGVSLFCGRTGKEEQDCEVPEHTHRSISETLVLRGDYKQTLSMAEAFSPAVDCNRLLMNEQNGEVLIVEESKSMHVLEYHKITT